MEKETIEKYVQAGKIAADALAYGKSLIKSGAKVIDVLDKVEERIIAAGGGLAFPAQISLNEVAAHYCSALNDATILNQQLVKLDVGVEIDGYIADCALTVDLSGKNARLVEASEKALAAALKIVKPGVSLGEIGKVIQETITSYGFAPIKNLGGHGLDQYNIHSHPSIPNFDNGNKNVLEEGMVIAIEPFASTGAGVVQESSPATVFHLVEERGIRDPITRNVLREIKSYKGLPFTSRWLERKFGAAKTAFALRQLLNFNCLYDHPPLIDQNRGLVSQAEHSVIVLEKPIVFTRF